jgi:hypothetical protein
MAAQEFSEKYIEVSVGINAICGIAIICGSSIRID